ncbi:MULTISPECIES: hypothetical protein [unclassified Streptomyces]|uniref:hypothetical protein n=1 Tax=unclassified Streptomyces TaxID=2593676 RepID=UPI0004C7EF1E|nr:hypothetical protein [Streptomyces sp. NRRL S-31]
MTDLRYDTLLARRQGLVRDLPESSHEGADLRWVMNSATLIYGEHDAVLADTVGVRGGLPHAVDRGQLRPGDAFRVRAVEVVRLSALTALEPPSTLPRG